MTKALIIVASWDNRFYEGAKRSLEAGDISIVYCISSTGYADSTQNDRYRLSALCDQAGAMLSNFYIDFDDQVQLLYGIRILAEKLKQEEFGDLIFDISTAPRNLIWILLGEVEKFTDEVSIRYFPALSYNSWLTNDEGDPRLIINNSGVMYPDLPTCLVMLCGPDTSRAEKLCYRYEPRKIIIIRDIDAERYGDSQKLSHTLGASVEYITMDTKDVSDENVARIIGLLDPISLDYNIVCSSFGPKLGGIILFKISRILVDIALGYLPSGLHNMAPSTGIGEVRDQILKLR